VRLALALVVSPLAWSQLPPRQMNQSDPTVEAREKDEVITTLAGALADSYTFPDVATKLAKMLKDRQTHGAYAKISGAEEFGELVSRQLAEIAHDRHLRLIYSAKVLPPRPAPKPGDSPLAPNPDRAQQIEPQRRRNYGFEKVERLPGNIGYVKLNQFADAAAGGDRVAAAMTFLADTDALIIDLRDNPGGGPTMVQLLASYFFSGAMPVHLNDLAWRRIGTDAEEVTQWWTLPYLPGKRYLDKDVYILTSHETFSAAEEFTYDLRTQQRATVVGETTGGGANPGSLRRLSDHYLAFIPTGRAINPVTGTNWEAKGIVPNVQVPKEEALKSAHRAALQRLLGQVHDEQEASELRQALASLEGGPGNR
jgi:hypothetical protein